jgi:hypothetical protein
MGSGKHPTKVKLTATTTIPVKIAYRTILQIYRHERSFPNLQGMSAAYEDWGRDASLGDVRAALQSWMRHGAAEDFDQKALALFRWQAFHNEVYSTFVRALGIHPEDVQEVKDIPFLPVEVFKSHCVQSGLWTIEHTFRSSGTSQTVQRAHHHLDESGLDWYFGVTQRAWKEVWGHDVSSHSWLGLLPGYVGREDASLLAMVSNFMEQSGTPNDAMLMDDHHALMTRLRSWAASDDDRPMVLFGVTWAVLDWVDALDANPSWAQGIPWSRVTLVDTGGMKGRGLEPIRDEVQTRIHQVLPGLRLASEYGMTEMMSQGYAVDGIHHVFPKWVRPLVRDLRDPRSEELMGRTGRLDVVDLANVHSCAFLATGDAAQRVEKGWVLLGRTDRSEARGCSLLAAL